MSFVDASPAGDERCRAALKELVVDGRLWEIDFGPSSLSVANRKLQVPPGCELVFADRIRCPEAELHWRDPSPNCRTTPDEARAAYERLLRRVGQVTQPQSPYRCNALGEALECQHYVLKARGQAPTTIITSNRGCSQPMVQCNFLKPPGRQFPQPCDQVFSGEP